MDFQANHLRDFELSAMMKFIKSAHQCAGFFPDHESLPVPELNVLRRKSKEGKIEFEKGLN